MILPLQVLLSDLSLGPRLVFPLVFIQMLFDAVIQSTSIFAGRPDVEIAIKLRLKLVCRRYNSKIDAGLSSVSFW